MRADVQKSDLRRGTQGRGCNTIGSPPVTVKAYHVHPAVTRRKQPSSPREALRKLGESAEGIVNGLSGKASETLRGGNAELTDRLSRKATIEGLNGKRHRMGREV